jgi:hypothetical protein
VQPIAAGVEDPRGGTWGAAGTILFGNGNNCIRRVSATGGPVNDATKLDVAHGEGTHRWPKFLPDGRHFLFSIRASNEQRGIYADSLDGKPKKRYRCEKRIRI